MRILFIILFILINFISTAQNGGQFSQNDVISVSYLGYENNTYLFKITNKLDCDIEVRYRFEQTPSVNVIIPKLSSIHVSVPYESLPSVDFTVKPVSQTVCILGGSQIDMGLLEITLSPTLNLQNNNFITNRRNSSNISVYIEKDVLKTNIGNNVHLQMVTMYDINGKILFKDSRIINKHSEISLKKHFCSGFNFIIVRIENNLKDVFLLKYYNQ